MPVHECRRGQKKKDQEQRQRGIEAMRPPRSNGTPWVEVDSGRRPQFTQRLFRRREPDACVRHRRNERSRIEPDARKFARTPAAELGPVPIGCVARVAVFGHACSPTSSRNARDLPYRDPRGQDDERIDHDEECDEIHGGCSARHGEFVPLRRRHGTQLLGDIKARELVRAAFAIACRTEVDRVAGIAYLCRTGAHPQADQIDQACEGGELRRRRFGQRFDGIH